MYAWSAWRNGSNVGSGWAGAVVGGSVGPHAAAKQRITGTSKAEQRFCMQPEWQTPCPGRGSVTIKSRIPNAKSLQCCEDRSHPIDFGALIGFDVGDEAEDR